MNKKPTRNFSRNNDKPQNKKSYEKPAFKKPSRPSDNEERPRRKTSEKPNFRKSSYTDRNKENENRSERKPYEKPAFRKSSRPSDNEERPRRKTSEKPSFKKSGYTNRESDKKPYGKPRSKQTGYSDRNNKNENRSERKTYGKPDFKKTSYSDKNSYKPRGKSSKKEERGYADEYKKFDWPIRLNRYLSNAGICGRREADKLIEQGLVTVNGKVVTELGAKVEQRDIVKYNGIKILPEKPVYILLNKPKNHITTTSDEAGRKTVMDLVADATDARVYPVGRLDRNTMGVLLLTNDGEIAQKLTHPSFEVRKIYEVTLEKKATIQELETLAKGVELEDGLAFADSIAFPDPANKLVIGIEIHSGKNRIVRRMFEHLGHTVAKLDRVMFGPFTKKGLDRGKYRLLKNSEIATLKRAKKKL